jgi:hypothetical protein
MNYLLCFMIGAGISSLVAFIVDASKAAREAQAWYGDGTPTKEEDE